MSDRHTLICMSDTVSRFFPGFTALRRDVDGVTLNGVIGGKGPPLLLLHGWPQTHVLWHRIAPRLAERFTVIATDLRGYGDSSKPDGGAKHVEYSKRVMARDQVQLMRLLGYEQFAVIGHDRGARVACRMALDHPQAVTQLTMLDIAPTLTLYSSVTKEFATAYAHWFWLIQPAPVPETTLGNNANFFLRDWVFRGLIPSAISEAAYAEYLRCFSDPPTLHAMCEDYRAAATIDLEHDRADAGQRIPCPTFILWGEKGAMGRLYDMPKMWAERAPHARTQVLPGGHWLPEECPEELLAALTSDWLG
jgi:haloacetate dehalogenase